MMFYISIIFHTLLNTLISDIYLLNNLKKIETNNVVRYMAITETIITFLLTLIIMELILFIIGFIFTRWRAFKIGWDPSYKKALIPNLLILVINTIFWILPISYILIFFLILIDIMVGTIVAMKLYEQNSSESFKIIVLIQMVLWIIRIVYIFMWN